MEDVALIEYASRSRRHRSRVRQVSSRPRPRCPAKPESIKPMKLWIGTLLMTALLQQPDAETRVINYLKANVKPGQPVIVADLVNRVFKAPDEQQALQRLYNTF